MQSDIRSPRRNSAYGCGTGGGDSLTGSYLRINAAAFPQASADCPRNSTSLSQVVSRRPCVPVKFSLFRVATPPINSTFVNSVCFTSFQSAVSRLSGSPLSRTQPRLTSFAQFWVSCCYQDSPIAPLI